MEALFHELGPPWNRIVRQEAVSGRSTAIHRAGHFWVPAVPSTGRALSHIQPHRLPLQERVWTAWTGVDSTLSTLNFMISLTKALVWTVWTAFMGRDSYARARTCTWSLRVRAHMT